MPRDDRYIFGSIHETSSTRTNMQKQTELHINKMTEGSNNTYNSSVSSLPVNLGLVSGDGDIVQDTGIRCTDITNMDRVTSTERIVNNFMVSDSRDTEPNTNSINLQEQIETSLNNQLKGGNSTNNIRVSKIPVNLSYLSGEGERAHEADLWRTDNISRSNFSSMERTSDGIQNTDPRGTEASLNPPRFVAKSNINSKHTYTDLSINKLQRLDPRLPEFKNSSTQDCYSIPTSLNKPVMTINRTDEEHMRSDTKTSEARERSLKKSSDRLREERRKLFDPG